MKLKSIKSAKTLKNKRILLRLDLDLPLKNNQVADDSRLQAALFTINYLLTKKAKLILVGHLGRPNGKLVSRLSLKPVQKKLAKLLNQTITLIPLERYIGSQAAQAAQDMQPGQIIMLENIRFSDREEKNCKKFAKKLAALADLYVNNAFSASHRFHSSIDAIQKYLPSFIGFKVAEEIKNLSPFINHPQHPLVLIVGGAKMETKIPVIKNFLSSADHILLGGAIANTFLKSLNFEIGQSLICNQCLNPAKKIFNQAKHSNLILPVDAQTNLTTKPVDSLNSNEAILDIGPQTIKLYTQLIKLAKTIIWNGPLGKFEHKKFAAGTQKVLAQVLKSKAKIVVGGGDTHQIFKAKKIPANIFISSGGGAILGFLSGNKLPGLQ